jgi:iron complex outermembrane receptor protein
MDRLRLHIEVKPGRSPMGRDSPGTHGPRSKSFLIAFKEDISEIVHESREVLRPECVKYNKPELFRQSWGSTMHSRTIPKVVCVVAWAAVGLGAIVFAQAADTAAVSQPAMFDIKPQPLASALNAFATQSDQQILFTPEVVAGKTSRGIKGAASSDAALAQVLTGTGLISSRSPDGMILVTTADAEEASAKSNPRLAPSGAINDQDRSQLTSRGGDQTTQSAALEEVIVTARRREETLQTVPVAASAFNGEQLKQESVKTVSDLQALVPSLLITQAFDDPQSIIVTMRGRKQDDATLAVDSSVSLNVDGLYIPRTLGMAGSMLDIARVEVLRGPQGTLYGRNTTGGALGIFTNDPTHDWSGSVDVTGGNFGAWNIVGIANVPIADNLDARFVAQRGANDGYNHTSTGAKIDSEDSQYYRAKLRWHGPDNWQAVLSGHYESNRAGGQKQVVSGLTPAAGGLPAGSYLTRELEAESVALRGGLLPNGLPATDANSVAQLNSWIAAKTPWFELNSIGGPPAFGNIQRWDVGLNVSSNLTDALSFHSISGVQHLIRSTRSFSESPVTVFINADGATRSTDTYYSQELQLLGTQPRLNWVVGVYGGDELGYESQKSIFFPYVFGYDAPLNESGIHNSTLAGYAQGTWEFITDWHLTAGARDTRDWRRIDETTLLGTPPTLLPAVECLVPAPGVLVTDGVTPGTFQCPRAFSASFAKPTWLVSIDHQLTPGALLYAKVATGYRSGGLNAESGLNDVGSFGPFRPETNLEYELGVKSELFDHRLRLNLAAYHDKYSDLQVVSNFLSPSNLWVSVETNAAKATIEGLEAEATAIITSSLRLHASAAYTDAHYDSFPDIDLTTDSPIDRSHEPFPVPRWTGTLGGNYTRPTAVGDLSVELDYSWKSDVNVVPQGTLLARQNTQGSYGLLDARVNWHLDAPDVDLALFGKNLTNKTFFDQGYTVEVVGFDVVLEGPPRIFGVEVLKKFGK